MLINRHAAASFDRQRGFFPFDGLVNQYSAFERQHVVRKTLASLLLVQPHRRIAVVVLRVGSRRVVFRKVYFFKFSMIAEA